MRDSTKPSGFDELVAEIHNSNSDATNSSLQEKVLKDCVNYLYANHQSHAHWFCDRHMNPMAVHALILFSFSDNNVLQWLKPKISSSIMSCEDCTIAFYEGISQLRSDFLTKRAISVKQVSQFLDVILAWRATNLSSETVHFFETKPSDKFPFYVISECLICPNLMRTSSDLKRDFLKLFSVLHENGKLQFPTQLLAGAIYCCMEGGDLEKQWAHEWLSTLHHQENRIYTEDLLSRLVADEFSTHLYKIQDAKYFTPDLCIRFWTMFLSLFSIISTSCLMVNLNSPYDMEVMSQHVNIRLFPLFRVFVNHMLANLNEPVPILLTVFKQLLCVLKCDFWENVKPYIFINILDTLLVNQNYTIYLNSLELSFKGTKNDFKGPAIDWISPFLKSLSGTQYQNASIRLSQFLIKKVPDVTSWSPEVSMNPGTIILAYLGCFVLLENLQDLAITNESKPETVTANLVMRRDVRAAIDDHATLITKLSYLDTGDLYDDEIHSIPQRLVFEAISYDCTRLSINSRMIQAETPPSYMESFMKIINLSVEQKVYLHPELIGAWLGAFEDACMILNFKEKKQETSTNREFLNLRTKHNKQADEMTTYVRKFLETASLADQNELRKVFNDLKSQSGFWSCLFSSQISLSAVNILYEMFDVGVGGRFEAIQALLSCSMNQTINAISINLDRLSQLEAFEPCPKTIRIMMDVFKALTDPLNDLLSFSDHVRGKEGGSKDIQRLWNSSWQLLVMIYKRTLIWANLYHLDQLIEFARDTLDLSHILLDSFRLVLQSTVPSLEKPLFSVFFSAFNSMIVWLRLGDPALLNSCVELVFKGFALAKDLKYTIDDDFLQNFTRYGARAKKFNNKLSEQQRLQILSTAREFNADLVESIIEEVQKQKGKEQLAVKSKAPLMSPSPDIGPAPSRYAYQTNGPKQQSLTKFGIITSQPPVAPPPVQTKFKSSSLEAIRQDLLANRTLQSKPANPRPTVIAPARAAGFNPRPAQPVVGRSLNSLKRKKHSESEDEDDNDDDDVDVSDLFVDKKKRAKIVELDINGKPVTKQTGLSRVSQKRREEDRMRMRLNVNLKPLYSAILKWNFGSSEKYPTADSEKYKDTKPTYEDAKDYVKYMEPLLMLECWQGIVSSRETNQETPFTMLIGSRTSVDGFFDVYTSVEKKILSERKITDSDLLVLSYVDNAAQKSSRELSEHLKKPGSLTCLAKVRELKSASSEYADVTIRVYPQGAMMGVLTPKSVVTGMKVMQMITIEREYLSLRGLEYYNLATEILLASPAGPIDVREQDLQETMKSYGVNKSQANAIVSTHNRDGFSLIQGPPGTGKTKTILGIIGYNLSKDKNFGVIEVKGQSNKAPTTSKILVCAPSNAAVDELVLRLRDGVIDFRGNSMRPSVVRLGRSDAVNSAVRDFTLEELVDKQLQTKEQPAARDPEVRVEHTKLVNERNELRQVLQQSDLLEEQFTKMEQQLRDVNKRRNELAKKLDEQRENAAVAYRSRELERRQLQAKILNEAQVICSTLSGSAHDFLSSLGLTFEKVIIDEACQCVELSAIIPLRYGCTKCIMVGDPNQLPPTVLSQTAASLKYDRSLFVRMQEQFPECAHLLDVQYRMHPDISKFPSAEFYASRLHDGEGMLQKNTRPWHSERFFGPYRFFDVVGKHQQHELTRSLFNRSEAQIVLEMVEHLMQALPSNEFTGRIGVISPYKEQIRTLKDIFSRKFGRQILNEVDFNTVDGYQGQEKEIIIMSCVRASDTGNVGFLSDVRRMNVALTRARTTLWILGNSKSLSRNKVWKRLLEDASSRGVVSEIRPGFLKNQGYNGWKSKNDIRTHSKELTFTSNGDSVEKNTTNGGKNKTKTVRTENKSNSGKLHDKSSITTTYVSNTAAKSSIFKTQQTEDSKLNKRSADSRHEHKEPHIAHLKPRALDTKTDSRNVDSVTKEFTQNVSQVKPSSSGVISKPKSTSSIFINNRKRRKQ